MDEVVDSTFNPLDMNPFDRGDTDWSSVVVCSGSAIGIAAGLVAGTASGLVGA